MISDNYKNPPRAGELEDVDGTKLFYLAPRPLPTGAAVATSSFLSREFLGHCMDLNTQSATMEFVTRAAIGSIIALIWLYFISSLGMTYMETTHNKLGYSIHFITVFFNPYFWGFIAVLISIHIGVGLRTCLQLATHPPVRFSRQRREVAYVPKRGQPPRFVPWEEVIACVTSGKVITQYGTHNSFSLMIGLRDAQSGDVLWLTVPTGSLMLAVSEWEAIRAYMEEGPSALPRPMSEEHKEGTVAYFHFCRRVYRENHSYPRYLFGFLMIQFCSGWTLPCHIAAWVERLPKTSFPKSVMAWSKPLPPEQCQKPSEELIEQSRAVRKSLRKGKSLFDHFQSEVKPG